MNDRGPGHGFDLLPGRITFERVGAGRYDPGRRRTQSPGWNLQQPEPGALHWPPRATLPNSGLGPLQTYLERRRCARFIDNEHKSSRIPRQITAKFDADLGRCPVCSREPSSRVTEIKSANSACKDGGRKRCPAPIHSLPPLLGAVRSYRRQACPAFHLHRDQSSPPACGAASPRPGIPRGGSSSESGSTWLCAARIAAARSSGLSAPTSICGTSAPCRTIAGSHGTYRIFPHGELPLKLAPTLTVPHRLSSIPTQQHTERPQSGC